MSLAPSFGCHGDVLVGSAIAQPPSTLREVTGTSYDHGTPPASDQVTWSVLLAVSPVRRGGSAVTVTGPEPSPLVADVKAEPTVLPVLVPTNRRAGSAKERCCHACAKAVISDRAA